jgi:hypothetical protein
MTDNSTVDLDQEEEKKPAAIREAYQKRLSHLKRAQEYSRADEIPKAVQHYNIYLNSLANWYSVKEEKLHPKLFDKDKDITELLLISHAYWDLSRAYDRSPKLLNEASRCLDQFVRFSTGYKFQHVNAQMCKKFLKKNQAYNEKLFKRAYERIEIKSKGCFVATECYGDLHPNTVLLRSYKWNVLAKSELGKRFVSAYYTFCHHYLPWGEKWPRTFRLVNQTLFKPTIAAIVYLLRKQRF